MFSCKFSFVYKYLYSYTFYTPSLFLVPDQNSCTKPWKTDSWFWRHFCWYTTFSETFHYLAGSRCHFGGSLLRRDQDKQALCPLFLMALILSSIFSISLLPTNQTGTASLYFFFSTFPMSWKGGSIFQQVFTWHAPPKPWHLHQAIRLDRTICKGKELHPFKWRCS